MRVIAAALALSALTASCRADVTVVQAGGDVTLGNPFVRLTISPKRGGEIVSYVVKATGVELIKEGGFLVGDHFWQQTWPGELLNQPYDVKIVSQTPQEAAVQVSRVAQGYSGSAAQAGLRVIRTMTLRGDSPVLSVHVGVENTAPSGRAMGYWTQSLFFGDGDRDVPQLYFRPTVRGTCDVRYDPATTKISVVNGEASGFVRDPQEGWSATIGAKNHQGLAFVMAYDELLYLYDSIGSTTEWQYRKTSVPAGKTWTTDFVLYPVQGLARLDYASRTLAAGVEPSDSGGTLTARVSLVAAGGPLQDVQVGGMMLLARTGQSVPLPAQRSPSVTDTPAPLTFTLPHDPQEPVALRFDVTATQDGKPVKEHFETWYGAGYGQNRTVAGGPLYALPSPVRHVAFLKPDVIVKAHNATPRVLLGKGLYFDALLPPAAFVALNGQTSSAYYAPAGQFPASLTGFPASYEELMTLDTIALVNVDADALGAPGQEMLKDFVTYGGTLIYGGALWGYRAGGIQGTALADLLPVTQDAASKPTYTDAPVLVVGTGGPLSPGAAMPFASPGFRAKPGADVLLSAGGEPVVVSWKVGKGRVVAVTGTALGVARPGETLWTQTPEWARLLTDLMRPND